MSNPVPEPTNLSPEAVISQLRTMRSQIEEVAPLTQEQRKLVRQRLRIHPKPIVEASINVIGVLDNVSQAIGQPLDEVRQLQDPTVAIRNRMYAAEILDSPPSPDETVIAIPPEGRDSGRGRILIRIGIGEWSWVGSFACGNHHSSTVLLMPDGKHLFVSAAGAGYIIDAKTRTLVEELGTEVVRAMSDEPMTLLIVNHNDLCLEAFGKTGRLWKTRPIGSGGIRGMELTNDTLIGEVRHPFRPGWTGFAVNLATGDVYLNGF